MIRRLCALLFLAVFLCGCGKREEPSVGIVNPISTSSLEAMEAEVGIDLPRFADLPELAVRRYDLDPVLYELEFTHEDVICTLRLSPGEGQGDLSGMYFSWTEELAGEGYQIFLDGAGHGICLWEADGFTWALSLDEGAKAGILAELYTLIMK